MRSATFTTINDSQHAEMLQAELSTLLEKTAITEVESRNSGRVFFTSVSWSPGGTGEFILSWTTLWCALSTKAVGSLDDGATIG